MKTYQLKYLYLFLVPVLLFACSLSKNPQGNQIKLLQKGKIKEDTSFVYGLPYEAGKAHLLVQGYYSKYTHRNRAALDFKMKKGTKVCAARDGIVLRIKEDGDKGGSNKKYRPYGNYIILMHHDSSRTGYWHLQHNGVFVNPGDTVKQGQVIGLSGRTGYSFFPHLHFIVWKPDDKARWKQVGSRFQTQKGILYLRPFRFYRNTKPKN